jgi:hypothetical protein
MAMVRKGIEKVQESVERSGSFSGGSRRYFKWTPGEAKTVRFLTDGDDIAMAVIHEFVPCHDGSKRSFVCRQEFDERCELCDTPDVRKREIAYGIAVWREPVKKDGKTVFRTKTEMLDIEVDGKKDSKEVPWVGIIQQAPRNFWAWFYVAYNNKGTLLDRDYTIKRIGQGKETDYQPFPEDPQDLDLSKFKEYMPDLEGMIQFLGSKEYYDKWLHGITESRDESKSDTPVEVTEEDLAILRAANEDVASEAVSGQFD